MKEKKKMGTLEKFLIVVGGVALTAVGFAVIPPLVEQYSNKLYKATLKTDEIDFDNMGPEIVPKEVNEEE